jgi:hypothetical protein
MEVLAALVGVAAAVAVMGVMEPQAHREGMVRAVEAVAAASEAAHRGRSAGQVSSSPGRHSSV